MKVLKNFNNISDELYASIPKLEGVRTFQMLTGTVFVNVNEDGTHTHENVYGKVQIPTRDKIKDPFTNKFVDIGVVEYAEGDTVKTTKFFMPGLGEAQFLGKFSLTEGSVDDEELWEYLCISNYNEDNPNRDKRAQPLFKIIDTLKDSKKASKKKDLLRDALNIASELNLPEAKDIAYSLNREFADADVLTEWVYDYASKNPEEFLARFTDPNTKVKSDIKRGESNGIIAFDPATKRVVWAKSSTSIATMDMQEGKLWIDQFAEWCNTHTNGRNTLAAIRKQVKAVLKEQVEETAE